MNIPLPDIKNLMPKRSDSPDIEPAPVADTPDADTAEPTPVPTPESEKITFSIDDEFSRMVQRAQGNTDAAAAVPALQPAEQKPVAFTITDNQTGTPQPEEEPAHYSEFENVHTSHHYTADELYDPHLDLTV